MLLCVLALFVSTPLCAAAAIPNQPVEHVTLGKSAVELTWPWHFKTGDNPGWSQADFDDSGWDIVDLSPPPGSYDPFLGTEGFVPGWTTHGLAGYSGFAWYRIRISLEHSQSGQFTRTLQVKLPSDVDDAYQVFVNGQMIGEFGEFSPGKITTYTTLPRAFALPSEVQDGPVTIAVRVWMNTSTPLSNPDAGGLHGPLLLGEASTVQAMLHLDWDSVNRSQYSRMLESALLLLAITVVVVLFRLERREKSYLWLLAALGAVLLQTLLVLTVNYTSLLPSRFAFLLLDAILPPAVIGLWVLFWAHWFRLKEMKKLFWMVGTMVLLLMVCMAMLREPLYGWLVPVQLVYILSPVSLLLKLLLGALLLWVAWEGMRHDYTGGWLALPAVMLLFITLYQDNLMRLHVPLSFFVFGYAVSIGQVAVILSLNMITLLLMRRFLQSQRRREQMRLEVEQAQQVQHLLIPKAIPSIPGFAIESAYYPAQEVGGDFFQIIPDRAGGVLIVLGDVTGKGLQAGMLVALIVGAIHTIVEMSIEPAFVLQALNRRLCARSQACATCMAIHIDANGETIIANAGHLPPYLNKKEVPIEGNLPLGISEAVRFDQTCLKLLPGERMTLVTDGVVEARNNKGELYGFNQTRAISHLPANFIAKAAQIFGQDDDITVLAVSLLGPGDRRNSGSMQMTAGFAEV
jgi:hypothetical protein